MKITIIFYLVMLVCSVSVEAQTTRPPDTSPHKSGFVTSNGIKIHYLDWGGSGETLLFIAGSGNNAHIFDEMAPNFTDKFRVLAVTRRGYGESDKPEKGYDVPTLTEDVRSFLDVMKIDKVNLIGHSAGGNEMIRFASEYPKRTLKLVFLDAAYDRREIAGLMTKDPLAEPEKEPSTLRERIEKEFFSQMDIFEPTYKKIKAPALSFYAIYEERWDLKPDADNETKKKAQDFIDKIARPYQFRNIEKFRKEVARGKVVTLRGANHYFFQDPKQKDAIVTQVRGFLLKE